MSHQQLSAAVVALSNQMMATINDLYDLIALVSYHWIKKLKCILNPQCTTFKPDLL